jgi:hypothetical protein
VGADPNWLSTSNRAPEELYKNGLNRALFLPFIAMLREKMQVLELESPNDYRQHRLAGAQVYFHPAGKVKGEIQAIWDDLTGGAAGAPLILPVNGRSIDLPRFANGIGRATFWDLCSRPLGPGDFLAIAQAVIYLSLAPKSNAGYQAYNAARAFVKSDRSREVPAHLRNAPTRLMKDLGHGQAYRYAHDEPHGYAAGQSYLPEGMAEPNWYRPTDRGLEAKIAEKTGTPPSRAGPSRAGPSS